MPVYKDSIKTKDGRCYYFRVNYVSIGGEYKSYKSKRYASKKEAESAEAAYLVTYGKVPSSRLTFAQAGAEYLNSKLKVLKSGSWRSIQNLTSYVCSQLGSIEITNITKKQYEDFRSWIDEHDWSVSYKNKVIKCCKAIISFADKNYDVSTPIPKKYAPFKNPDMLPEPMDFFTYDEFLRFDSVIDDVRFSAFFAVLFYCGLRLGEADALTWTDVNFANGTISITKSVNTKIKGTNSKYLISSPKTPSSVRVIPFPAIVRERLLALRHYYERFDAYSASWFVFGGINPIPETTATKAKDKYCKLANVKRIRIHDFRHSCASFMIHLNCSPAVLARLLGHASVKVTLDTYSHLYDSDLASVVSLIDSLNNK